MSKVLKICLSLLVVLSAVNSQQIGSHPRAPRNRNFSTFNVPNSPWRTFCEDNNVPSDRYFTYPGVCHWYIQCWDWEQGNGVETSIEFCDPDNWMNDDWWYEEAPDRSWGGCFDRDDVCRSQDPVYPPICPPTLPNEVVFAPSEDCNAYYICINGVPIERRCHPRLHWDPIRERCDDPARAGCLGSQGPKLPVCAPTVNDNFPHPTDCELFIACRNGNRLVQRCVHMHHFDVETRSCRPMHEALCYLDY